MNSYNNLYKMCILILFCLKSMNILYILIGCLFDYLSRDVESFKGFFLLK